KGAVATIAHPRSLHLALPILSETQVTVRRRRDQNNHSPTLNFPPDCSKISFLIRSPAARSASRSTLSGFEFLSTVAATGFSLAGRFETTGKSVNPFKRSQCT